MKYLQKKLELFFGKMESIFLEETENFVYLLCQYWKSFMKMNQLK